MHKLNIRNRAVLCLLAWSLITTNLNAQTRDEAGSDEAPVGYWNFATPTLGGLQFWTNVRSVGGWEIQRNSTTGHFRLIDSSGYRQAWGNCAHCNLVLDSQIANGKVSPYQGKVVVLLHGLMRTSNSLNSLSEYLSQRGFQPIRFQYASSRETIDVHARDLKSILDCLGPEVTEINFVGHSLGNIVVRHYLGDCKRAGVKPDPRLHRMVMLGPPNQGSKMARVLKNSLTFKTLAGVSGLQLGAGWNKLEPKLAIPDFEFGVIAGGQSDENDLSNFMLKGKDDFTVSVNEAKLAGASDLLIRPLVHSTMMNQNEVHEATVKFIENGYFVDANKRNPVPLSYKINRKPASDGGIGE